MKKWFSSLKGAITLSVIALLTEAWRGFLDAMFVLAVDFNNPVTLNLAAVIFTALFGGWAWLLILANRGRRGAVIGTFVLNVVVLFAIPVSWLLFYCPADCQAEAGIFNLANTLNLVFGLLAGVSLGIQVFAKETQPTAIPAKVEA